MRPEVADTSAPRLGEARGAPVVSATPVLVLDPDHALRESWREALAAAGYVAFSAATLSDAIAMIEGDVRFVAALVDLRMGQHFRRYPLAVPVVYTSGDSRAEVLSAGLIAETDHFLQMPLHPAVLRALLDRIAIRRRVLARYGLPEPAEPQQLLADAC